MKKTLEALLFLVILGAIIFAGLLGWRRYQRKVTLSPEPTTVKTIHLADQVATAKVDLPDIAPTFTLKEGGADFALADNQGQGSAFVASDAVELVVGGQPAALAVVAINTGGTGVFNTLVLFKLEGDAVVGRSGVNIGDRIAVKKIEADPTEKGDLIVRVAILDRGPNEAMAAEPTIPKTVTIMVRNGKLDKTTLVIK